MTAGIKDYINKDGDTNTYAYNESQLEYKVSAENSAKKNKKAVMDWILDQELNFEPDEKYMYSNSAYFLLGDIIEQVSETSYEKYIKENNIDKNKIYQYITSTGKETLLYKNGEIVFNGEDIYKMKSRYSVIKKQ